MATMEQLLRKETEIQWLIDNDLDIDSVAVS